MGRSRRIRTSSPPPVREPDGVVRLGVSMDPELLRTLDEWVRLRNSRSRSDAIRFLVRKELGEETLGDPEADVVATVTLLYRHDTPSVQSRITAAAHRWGEHVKSSIHIHLRGNACVEVLVLMGRRLEVDRAAEDLRGVKGVVEGRFVLTTPGIAGGATGHTHPHHR
jgi:CopG family nickel-responsive transcriptional regulator